jgi:hypothetical protein
MTGTSFIPTLIAVIIVVRIRKYISRFSETGTTSPATAKTLEELNLKQRLIFYRLLRRKVIIESSPKRYYLHEENLISYNNTRRMIMLVVILIIATVILLDFLYLNF